MTTPAVQTYTTAEFGQDLDELFSAHLQEALASGLVRCHQERRPCEVDCPETDDCVRYQWALERRRTESPAATVTAAGQLNPEE